MWWLYPPALAIFMGAPVYFVSRWKNPPETRLVAFIAASIMGVPLFLLSAFNVWLAYNP